MTGKPAEHGGGLDHAIDNYGGVRADWLDLSTGLNPVPYPVPDLLAQSWTDLPDHAAHAALIAAARAFWQVPDMLTILAAPGASALIARLPYLRAVGHAQIDPITYNEHGHAFRAAGWRVSERPSNTRVVVHPNNPTGEFCSLGAGSLKSGGLTVIDESFCDETPARSLIQLAMQPGVVVLKSFGKFWGLGGVRLGFAIGTGPTLAPLADLIGPWPVSGPALKIGTEALRDIGWAERTRIRLAADAHRLDGMLNPFGHLVGGTGLFRLFDIAGAASLKEHLCRHHILVRDFSYAGGWVRFGMPGSPDDWGRLQAALSGFK